MIKKTKSTDSADIINLYSEKKDLQKLLEFEIIRIQKEQSRPGWSAWALLGSLATIFWLITVTLDGKTIDLHNTLFLVFFFSILYDTIKYQSQFLSLNYPTSNSSTAIISTQKFFSPTRNNIFLVLVRNISLLILIISSPFNFSFFILLLCYFFYGIEIIGNTLSIILSFFNIPFSISAKSFKANIFANGFFFIFGFFIIYGLILMLLSQTISPKIVEYRLAGLITSASIIILLLSSSQGHHFLLDNLIDIRRNLGMDKTDVTFAKRQIEIAFYGMELDEFYQSDLNKLLSIMDEVNIEANTAINVADGVRRKYGENMDNWQLKDKEILKIAFKSIGNHIENIQNLLNKHSEQFRKFSKKIIKYSSNFSQSSKSVDKITSKLKQSEEETQKKVDNLNNLMFLFDHQHPILLA